MKRRQYLSGLTGIGALSSLGAGHVAASDPNARRLGISSAVGDDTHHPGPPRFGQVGQTFYDRMFTDFSNDHAGGKDRDNFAPQIVGEPQQDADNYSADDFSWSITSRPDGSTAEIEYAPADNGVPQYDSGDDNAAEFAPDVPGRYVLELDAPDGTHEQILHIFPEHGGAGGPPRIEIEGEYDGDADEFVLDSNPKLAPDTRMTEEELVVEWLADGRDALGTGDIQVGDGRDSWTARIPRSALGGESSRVHAAPYDTNAHGYTDTIVLDPGDEAVEHVNRPPEWIQNGIMYEIFPRSFMGPPEAGEWPLENSNANFSNFESKLDYLEEMNVDVIWFTPTVPSESANWKRQNADQWDGDGGNRFRFVGGGPHGYDALSYYQKAEDLTSEYSRSDYVDAPWPWEDGYDPADNAREEARASAMDEFQSFIEAAEERDIKICIDFVINHGGRHHPLFQDTIESISDFRPSGWTYRGIAENNENSKYFDWFARQDAPTETNSGEVVDPAPAMTGFAGLRVMPQWNFGNVATREHILAAAQHWAEMGVDAFRCDIAYGVPHGFWKEVRETVRAENSEFMMLDETIPNDPNFAENEFDMHFDTADFMKGAGQGVINGGDPMQLYDAVKKRETEGWPDYTLLANSTENHDEQRLYKIARDGARGDPAKAQRAVWASGVVLPGVPFIYYGQERLITEHGTQRHNYDGNNEDYRAGDVGPNNYKRAFMNWEENGDEVPADHLQFYKNVTRLYKDHDIFKPDADLRKTWFRSDDSVLAFGRSMGTEDGRQNVVVMVHFDPGTAQVDLLPGTSTTNMFDGDAAGEDIGVDNDGEGVTVEFDTLAVVETDSLFSVGDRIAMLDEETGDDNGPGSYTYPTGDVYTDGVFDISEVTVHTTAEDLQFRVAVDGDLSNPEGYDGGITAQHLQFYIQVPEAEAGATEGRAGTNVTFEEPYQYRVIANGEDGVVVEDHQGNEVAEGSLNANPVADELVIEMPRSVLDASVRSHRIAPLMFGYHPDEDGGVMPVESDAGTNAFGGADTPSMAPRVIDMVVPQTASQADALAHSNDEMATLPYTSLASEFEQIGQADDETGDDDGPGNFQYPSQPEDAYYDQAWDIDNLNVYESRSRVRFDYEMTAEIQNPWGLNGMSQQHIQIYIRDPDADDVASTTEGRTGLNAGFAEPYHYRVVVHGEGTEQVEGFQSDGGEVSQTVTSSDVNFVVDGNSIRIDLPKSAIGGSPTDKEIAALMIPYDGFGAGGIRQGFAESPGEHTVGTSGENTQNAPHVMDMITPDGTSQAQALAYSSNAKAEIPFAEFQNAFIQTAGLEPIDDPEGDDEGPGGYTYPTGDPFADGCFDVTQVDIESTTQFWNFTVHLGGELTNPWDGEAGFSVQALQLYFQDPNAPDDALASTSPRSGLTSSMQEDYHYRVAVHGENGPKVVEDPSGGTVAEDIPASGNMDDNTITFSVPKAPFDTDDLTEMKMAMLMLSKDGFGEGDIRQNFAGEPAEFTFGGVDPTQNAPRVIDLVGPENVVDQSEALSYSADSPASIPLFSVEALTTGEASSSLTVIAPSGPTVFAGQGGSLDASNSSDPEGRELTFSWEQTGGPDVQEFTDTDTAQPSFVAPAEVDEETELEFTVTVTNPDGDSASGTTAATVLPQSENDAPIAEAQISVGYEQPITAGERVEVNAYESEDPNGGTLSYEWTQAGGPSADLINTDGTTTFFDAPDVDAETAVTLELTVHDGQGKSATDTIDITVAPAEDSGGEGGSTTAEPTTMGDSGETTTMGGGDGDSGDTADGDGPGFGVVSSVLGTAGGAAYAARRLLSDDPEPEEVEAEVLDDDPEPVESDD